MGSGVQNGGDGSAVDDGDGEVSGGLDELGLLVVGGLEKKSRVAS